MNYLKLILVLLALTMPVLAEAHSYFTNEPAGATQILDCPFSGAPSTCGIEDVYSSAAFTSDGTAPLSPSGTIRSTLNPGNSQGGMQLDRPYSMVRETFVGMTWQANPTFQGRSGGNKTFFVRGPDSIGVFVIQGGLASGSGPFVWSHNSSALNNSHACVGSIGELCYPNVGSGTVFRGQWTKLEAYFKASTTNTSRDGIVKWWIDGQPAGNYTNLNYAGAGLNNWTWTETWDGCGGAVGCDLGVVNTQTWQHRIDHLYISAPNCPGTCGGGGGGGDTTPPGRATGLVVTQLN